MYKDGGISSKPAREIQEAEDTIAELTELPFKLNTPEHWKQLFREAGLVEIEINQSQNILGLRDMPIIIREMGGPLQLFKVFSYSRCSGKLLNMLF
jgi:hypothetical protein